MKFIRRHDLSTWTYIFAHFCSAIPSNTNGDLAQNMREFLSRYLTPHTRIAMVRLAWLHQGIYGKMTHLAQEYHISRTFLYQLMWAANRQLETLFTDQKPRVQDPHPLLEPFILLLRLE